MGGSVQALTRAAFLTPLSAALAADVTFAAKGKAQFGWTSDLENVRERVWTRGNQSNLEPVSLRSGPTVLSEDGNFYVFVEVVEPGGTLEAVLDRCYDLAAIVVGQAAIHKNDLAVTGLNWITPGATDLDGEGQVDRGAGARVRCTINYRARVETVA